MYYSYTILDSEATSTLQLQHFLEDFGNFECTEIVKRPSKALDSLLKFSPDLVFINLNQHADAYFTMILELYQFVDQLPTLIGISNTKEYAYRALKNNFFDYWLMPFDEFEIRKSVLRLKKHIPFLSEREMVCLKSYSDFLFLDANDILFLRADNNTTEFVMVDNQVNHAFKTLKTFETQLPPNFIRIHQSYIVNSRYVSRINYGKGVFSLKNKKEQLPFSRSYRANVDALKRKLAKNTICSKN